MTYLLDVNVLLALLFGHHEFHARAESWVVTQREKGTEFALATCPLTELGFLRIASGVTAFGVDLTEAKCLLLSFKKNQTLPIKFLSDDLSAIEMPSWVRKSPHVTDGYLSVLAKHHLARLVTLDEGIPQAMLIPR